MKHNGGKTMVKELEENGLPKSSYDTLNEVKLYSFAHSTGEWMYYDTFPTQACADMHVRVKGYNPKYFKSL